MAGASDGYENADCQHRLSLSLSSRSEMTASISALELSRCISESKNNNSVVSGSGDADCANLCNQEKPRRPTV